MGWNLIQDASCGSMWKIPWIYAEDACRAEIKSHDNNYNYKLFHDNNACNRFFLIAAWIFFPKEPSRHHMYVQQNIYMSQVELLTACFLSFSETCFLTFCATHVSYTHKPRYACLVGLATIIPSSSYLSFLVFCFNTYVYVYV